MKNTIATLLNIIKSSPDTREAAAEISDTFKKISPKSAKNIVSDVQDYIDEKLNTTQLSLYLQQAGLSD